MADIRSPRVLYVKGALFLLLGVLASAVLLLEHPSLKVAGLLALAVWAFARAYYFAFYVVEHYVDPGYKFAGLWSFVQYAVRRRNTGQGTQEPPADSVGGNPAGPAGESS
jgi:hypothetical protein